MPFSPATKSLMSSVSKAALMVGPGNTGMFDTWKGRPKIDIVRQLASLATGCRRDRTCAPLAASMRRGLILPTAPACSSTRTRRAGCLANAWRARSGRPVVNVSGCPAHPNTITKVLAMIAAGEEIALISSIARPPSFASLVHQGCTRNEYHEYDIEDSSSGGAAACSSVSVAGVRRPWRPCNTELWNGHSSKTRAGVPRSGCTSPSFPPDGDLFSTPRIGAIPKFLPLGVVRAKYMASRTSPAPLRRNAWSTGRWSRESRYCRYRPIASKVILSSSSIWRTGSSSTHARIGTLLPWLRADPDRASAERSLVITPRVCGICGRRISMPQPGTGANCWIKIECARGVHTQPSLMAETVQSDLRQTFPCSSPPISATRAHGGHCHGCRDQRRLCPTERVCRARLSPAEPRAFSIIAIFGGQWPHSSCMLPGGVSQPANSRRLMDAGRHRRPCGHGSRSPSSEATCTIFVPWTMPNRCSAGLKPTRVDAPPHSR